MNYPLKRTAPFEDNLDLLDESGNVVKTIHLSLDLETIMGRYTTAQALMAQKEKNAETYQAEVAEEQNRGIDAKLSQLYADAWKRLQAAQAAGIVQAEKWGDLDGAKITDDLRLLGGHFELKKPQVEALVEKYRGNGTMMEAIAKYAREHNMAFLNVPSVAGKKEAWAYILDHAKTLLDQATNPPAVGWMVGATATGAVKRQIDTFGTSNVPESKLFAAYQMVEH